MEVMVFWVVTPCKDVGYQHITCHCCLNFRTHPEH